MRVNYSSTLPDAAILKQSLTGVKAITHQYRISLVKHSQCKRNTSDMMDTFKFNARGATLAKKIIKLEAIILHLQICLALSLIKDVDHKESGLYP